MLNKKQILTTKTGFMQGFSLIELMIVVGIIGILASIAYPSYERFVVRANQSDAKDKISKVMYQQERYITRNRAYTTDLSDLGFANAVIRSDNGFYTISAAQCAGAGLNRCVLISAVPIAGTRQQNTGTFTLDSRGARTFDGTIGGWKK